MTILKQQFYEGAALHALIRAGKISSIEYQEPFFIFNGSISVSFKYSTAPKSPWGFTFTQREQAVISAKAVKSQIYIGLICGSDGIVALDYSSFKIVVPMQLFPVRVSCYRNHGEKYEVRGSEKSLPRKVSPSAWQSILE